MSFNSSFALKNLETSYSKGPLLSSKVEFETRSVESSSVFVNDASGPKRESQNINLGQRKSHSKYSHASREQLQYNNPFIDKKDQTAGYQSHIPLGMGNINYLDRNIHKSERSQFKKGLKGTDMPIFPSELFSQSSRMYRRPHFASYSSLSLIDCQRSKSEASKIMRSSSNLTLYKRQRIETLTQISNRTEQSLKNYRETKSKEKQISSQFKNKYRNQMGLRMDRLQNYLTKIKSQRRNEETAITTREHFSHRTTKQPLQENTNISHIFEQIQQIKREINQLKSQNKSSSKEVQSQRQGFSSSWNKNIQSIHSKVNRAEDVSVRPITQLIDPSQRSVLESPLGENQVGFFRAPQHHTVMPN